MKLFYLIRKDFLLSKRCLAFTLTFCFFMPPFVLWSIQEYAGIISFGMSAAYAIVMPLQHVSQKEFQYAKALSVLCATPYPRGLMVLARYIFCISVYFICCIIFWAETLVLPGLGGFDFKLFMMTFFVVTIFLGIYLPTQYKLGYEKTKFAFIFVAMATPVLLPFSLELGISLDFVDEISPGMLYCGIILLTAMILSLSISISIRLFKRTDMM